MKTLKLSTLIFLLPALLGSLVATSQPYKFYHSGVPVFLKNNNDTFRMALTGGMNAPQFSNIDLNNDGIKDLFVFDRTTNHSMTFVRQGSRFVYEPKYERFFPAMTDWVLLKDYNGDGKEDIFTETTRDKSQLIDTGGTPFMNGIRVLKNISDVSGLKFKAVYDQVIDTGGWWTDFGVPRDKLPVAMNRTDISAIEDLDGDGDLDIVCFNGVDFSPMYYENWAINDLNIPHHPDSLVFILRTQCWGNIQYDVNAGKNRFHLHKGKDQLAACQYELWRDKKAMHAGSTLLFLDINHDSVKDLIYGDLGFSDLLLLVNGRNSSHHVHKRDSILSQDTLFPSNSTYANFIPFPAAYYVDIDNDNVNELLVTTNKPSTVKSANNVWVYENTGTNALPTLNYQGNSSFPLNSEVIDLGTRSVPVMVDIDKDGDRDLIVATNGDYESTLGQNDRLVWFENLTTDSTKPVFRLKDTNFLQLSKDTPVLEMHPTFGDLNGDGKDDLVTGDLNGSLTYYINQSSGTNYSFVVAARNYSGINVGSFATPQLVDLDKDGKLDLVIGCKDGDIKYFRNRGTATSPSFMSTPDNDSLGGVAVNESYDYFGTTVYLPGYSAPHVCDLDNDGNYEMLVGSESGKIFLYRHVNPTNPTFTGYDKLLVTDSASIDRRVANAGNRSVPFAVNIDGDAKYDVVIGNVRGGLTLLSSVFLGTVGTPGGPEMRSRRVLMYPNPASDAVNLLSQNINEDLTYSVFDAVGREVSKGSMSRFHSEVTVQTSHLKPGMYFVVLHGSEGFSQALRLYVQR